MKNIDIVNKIISKKLSIDEKTVAKINKFYWKTIRRKLSSLESTSIFVKGFATFTLSRYNLRKEIQTTIERIRATPNSTKLKQVTKDLYIIILYERLKKLVVLRNKLAKIINHEHYKGISSFDSEST